VSAGKNNKQMFIYLLAYLLAGYGMPARALGDRTAGLRAYRKAVAFAQALESRLKS
jgi:hypothetical protein